MQSIVDAIKEKEFLISLKGATEDEINEAQRKLGLQFAPDYLEYVSTYGAVSYYEHELTGVCKGKALDVVAITNLEKQLYDVPEDWYVIEQAHIDGIIFWQNSKGYIFKTKGRSISAKVFDSLIEYVKQN